MKSSFRILIIIFFMVFRTQSQVITGSQQIERYLPYIKNKSVGIVCNHTAIVNNNHLVDTLLSLNIRIKKIFAPEHGFRGTMEAGEWVNSEIDIKTGIPIISLYGKKKKPTPEDLDNIDVLIYDIQDIGVRFYTYISTLHYVMEAAAENNIPIIVLDRPNPLGFYVDGPILDSSCRSFVGMHPIPIVYGMTTGELAQMINNEGWLKNKLHCNLIVIPCLNYQHSLRYQLNIKPSPNLINMTSIYLYPSLCLFEGTVISVGRGTDYPFQVAGHPALKDKYSFSFTPKTHNNNKAVLYNGITCYGIDLRHQFDSTFTLKYLIELYHNYPDKKHFFNSFFIKLIGDKQVYNAIKEGKNENEIRQLWNDKLSRFRELREKYLIYPD